jgi:beta-galactosidase GanA
MSDRRFPRSTSGTLIPRLERTGNAYHLLVDGQPFLVLGGQSHNSSASNPADLERVWAALNGLHANTAEIPLYWELIEPQPGQFDFQLVDAIVAGARRHGLRLILLWFASWKNGEMHYTPEWIKYDRVRYPRVRDPSGIDLDILSPLAEASRDADARAFAALMAHLCAIDEAERTVIMIQVENETGLLGADRDYAEAATRLFDSAVPTELIDYLGAHRDQLSASLRAIWAASEYRTTGT